MTAQPLNHGQFKLRPDEPPLVPQPPERNAELDWIRATDASIAAERDRLGLPPSRPPSSRQWGAGR